MKSNMDQVDAVLRHVWSEPRFVAWTEWFKDHPSLAQQLIEQVGYGAAERFAAGGGWENADQEISFVRYEEPDWDWWEPTSQWRRLDARSRAFREERECQGSDVAAN